MIREILIENWGLLLGVLMAAVLHGHMHLEIRRYWPGARFRPSIENIMAFFAVVIAASNCLLLHFERKSNFVHILKYKEVVAWIIFCVDNLAFLIVVALYGVTTISLLWKLKQAKRDMRISLKNS